MGLSQPLNAKKIRKWKNFLKPVPSTFVRENVPLPILVVGQTEESNHLLGYFTLAYKIIQIPISAITSNTFKKKVEQFVIWDVSTTATYTLPAILIGQFAKNDSQDGEYRDALKGDELMSRALYQVRCIQETVGGRVVFLECEDKPALMKFYNKAGFEKYNERIAEGTPEVKYNQLLKII